MSEQELTQWREVAAEYKQAASVEAGLRREFHDKIEAAIEIAVSYGQTDGAHHKTWVIDQMVRILAGDRYDSVVRDAKSGEHGPDTYRWDTGIAP
jgi:hypothetical protein